MHHFLTQLKKRHARKKLHHTQHTTNKRSHTPLRLGVIIFFAVTFTLGSTVPVYAASMPHIHCSPTWDGNRLDSLDADTWIHSGYPAIIGMTQPSAAQPESSGLQHFTFTHATKNWTQVQAGMGDLHWHFDYMTFDGGYKRTTTQTKYAWKANTGWHVIRVHWKAPLSYIPDKHTSCDLDVW